MRRLLRIIGAEWVTRAACAGMYGDLWYSETSGHYTNPEARAAKHICRVECPVRNECLDWAISNDEDFGVWGGLDPRERRLLRQRAAS